MRAGWLCVSHVLVLVLCWAWLGLVAGLTLRDDGHRQKQHFSLDLWTHLRYSTKLKRTTRYYSNLLRTAYSWRSKRIPQISGIFGLDNADYITSILDETRRGPFRAPANEEEEELANRARSRSRAKTRTRPRGPAPDRVVLDNGRTMLSTGERENDMRELMEQLRKAGR